MTRHRKLMENRNTSYSTPYSVKRSGYSGGPNHASRYHTHHVNRKLHSLRMEKNRRNAPKPSYGNWIAVAAVVAFLAVVLFYVGDKALHPVEKSTQKRDEAIEHVAQVTSSQFWTKAQRDEKLWIISHVDVYPSQLTKYVSQYPQTLDFCFHYPSKSEHAADINLSKEAAAQEVPLLIQWDERWGYRSYGSEYIGTAGSGPTCLAMIALYLLDDPTFSPGYVSEVAVAQGYCQQDGQTDTAFIGEGSEYFGLSATGCAANEADMKAALDAGHPLIAMVGEGGFTATSQYIVIVGYDEKGFNVNDPNSRDNSARTWTFDELKPQLDAMWEVSIA